MSSEGKNLEAISKAIDQHNQAASGPRWRRAQPVRARGLGWETIRGLPIRANPELGTGRFRVVCAREEGESGESVEAVAEQTVPAEPIKVG